MKDLQLAFLNRQSISGVTYQYNDYVRVVEGLHSGIYGSLISLEAIEPEPTFLVELEKGGDVYIRQSQLGLIDHDR